MIAMSTILCLPDHAAKDAVTLCTNENVKFLDASSAHRTEKGWVYGLVEYNQLQQRIIRQHHKISNPGCYPTGAILLLAPLMRHKIITEEYPVWVQGVSGYSGGGKKMIEQYEKNRPIESGYKLYGLDLHHKHLKEMYFYSLLKNFPIFTPAVAPFYSGMMITIALHVEDNEETAKRIHDCYHADYEVFSKISIAALNDGIGENALEANAYQGRDDILLHVIKGANKNHLLLCALYDNLGKGAAGSAMQNLELMLGMDTA